jgi:carbon monoxide dehydrogenase subunit G
VDLNASVDLDASPDRVRPLVATLDCYPEWLSIVAKAQPLEGPVDAWAIELRAKVGPLSRSKRLRMVRTVDDPSHLRFERIELDGRTHADWTLDVLLRPEGAQTELIMELHYGGGFGGGVVERLLASEIEESRRRLRALLDHDAAAS